MYLGTYVCLLTAFVSGGIDAAAQVVKKGTESINDAIGDITRGIDSTVSGVNGAIKKLPTIPGIDYPTVDLSEPLDNLKNIKIDSSNIVKGLNDLNNDFPTFKKIEQATKDAISVPFDLVRERIRDGLGDYQFDETVFPVAEKKALSFCSNNSRLNDFFDSLFELVAKAKIAFLVVIIVLAVLAIFAMGYLEIRRWRRERARAKVFTEHGYDPMDVVYIASRPFTAGWGIKIASRIKNPKRSLVVRWTIAYGTSLPALFVLSLAIAGFFSVLCQFILLRSIQAEAPGLADQVGDFAGDVVGSLQQVSTDWANNANSVLLTTESKINDDVFGWVKSATDAVNDTLTLLENKIDSGMNAVFGNTILNRTAVGVVNCLIGNKIDSIQAGLQWVEDAAKITLPKFANNTFSQGAQASVDGDSDLTSFLASPSTVTTDEITDAVDKVVNHIQSGLIVELLISCGLLLVYVIIILIGIIGAAISLGQRDKLRGEGGGQPHYNLDPSPDHNGPSGGTTAVYAPTQMGRRPLRTDGANRGSTEDDASPSYDEVVYAGRVKQGRTQIVSEEYASGAMSGANGNGNNNAHARKSSYPVFDDGTYPPEKQPYSYINDGPDR